ncbi:hypothetical protein [Dyella choica]|uniref:Uncharacterized protein n=1 Tax=Dyella choica TaxID=1927959 RepID=A0A432M0H6_9GAMM|nr:hypothetical protein [Dyella choica]RUL70266.1 hypothetical protein EKH80_20855 [Dyella choica]
MIKKALVATASVLFALAACAGIGKRVLERNAVLGFKVQEDRSANVDTLKLSGLSAHSSLVVSGYKTIREGDTLAVIVQLELTHDDLSGNFDYNIVIPSGVNVVTFGNDRTVIWHRH